MKRQHFSGVALFALLPPLACHHGPNPADVPANGAVLEVDEVTYQTPAGSMQLHADGRFEVSSIGLVGTVSSDGRFVSPQGALVARLDPDGRILLASGKELVEGLSLLPDGTLHAKQDASISDTGELVDDSGNPVKQIRISVSRHGVRRAAMFGMIVAPLAMVSLAEDKLAAARAKMKVLLNQAPVPVPPAHS